MAETREGFPEPRDEKIIQAAENLVNFADDLTDWMGKHTSARLDTDFAIDPEQVFKLLRLRRDANNLYNSSRVPVAAAVYGPSQVGKSLFMGRVLQPADDRDSPLGKSDKDSGDAYIPQLSFDFDINPQCGSSEATALVTRFTTKDRFDRHCLPEFAVKVRALSRAEWLRVLTRGFRSECPMVATTWEEGQVRELFEQATKTFGSETGNREWQMDLLDTYVYARSLDHRQYKIEESMFNSFLSRHPLSEAGYLEVAGRLFWDAGDAQPDVRKRISDLFSKVEKFLKQIAIEYGDGEKRLKRDGILVHWGAVRFLLDSRRTIVQPSPDSKWKSEVKWADFKLEKRDGWYVIDYKPGSGPPDVDLSVIQSAMLEMILPVVPHRLNGDWREVIKKMDVLDLPGMVSGGGDAQARGNTAESLEQQMMVVKRGKVFYLIDRYIDERQVQTMLVLFRGGNVQVRQVLEDCVNRWGKTRYGEQAWPRKISASDPALFIGMTGIDDEFSNRAAHHELYESRLTTIAEHTFRELMNNYGGAEQRFTNVFPIRYPGTWDTNAPRRATLGEGKWQEARKAFLNSPKVKVYVRDAERRWDAAMRDEDGGMSLICEGFLKCTNSLQKQESLEQQIREIGQDVRNLCRSWFVDPNANLNRQKRVDVADKVLQWLEHEELVYERVHALESALCFDEGNADELTSIADRRSVKPGLKEKLEDRFPKHLKSLLGTWAVTWAPDRWNKYTARHDDGGPWLAAEDFGALVRYLNDYLCTEAVFNQLSDRLLKVISLPVGDQGARRFVVREYVQLLLNDFVMNPGPEMSPLGPSTHSNGCQFGLMQPLVTRWRHRLPHALASAAGEHQQIPSGNDELQQILAEG